MKWPGMDYKGKRAIDKAIACYCYTATPTVHDCQKNCKSKSKCRFFHRPNLTLKRPSPGTAASLGTGVRTVHFVGYDFSSTDPAPDKT